jgi:hypothetical protein
MKTMKHFLYILAVLFTGISIQATASDENSQTRSVKDFNAIKVSTGVQLYLSMDDRQEVRIEANDDIISDVVTEVKDQTLHIYVRKNNMFKFFNWGSRNTVKAYVSATEINSLGASSGANIRSENTLEGNSLVLDMSSGGGMTLDVVYKDIKMEGSSGANAKLSGKAKTFRVSASSGSNINAGNLDAVNCKANASSGANISMVATGEITAHSSSGGSIRYSGNPGVKDINKSSGGTVSQR